MIRISLSVLILALAAAPALAQSAGDGPSAAPKAGVSEAGGGTAQAAITLDTPIQTLAAVAGARAVLERELPGLIGHERYEQFKTMSLKALKPFSGGLITDERLAAVETALADLAAGADAPAPAEHK